MRYIMSNRVIQTQPGEAIATLPLLTNEFFGSYSPSEIQEALEGILAMASESQEFVDMTGLQRNNTITFMNNVKGYFQKASALINKEGGVQC